jgi:hypothetical protein
MLIISERHSDSHAHSSQPRTVDLTLMKSEAQGCNLMFTEGPDRAVLKIHKNCSNRSFLLNLESDFEYQFFSLIMFLCLTTHVR